MNSNPFWNNRYSLQKKLGKGGMGTVYLAIDSLTNKEVAIKECDISYKKNPENTTFYRILW